jgi:hypothetical protein
MDYGSVTSVAMSMRAMMVRAVVIVRLTRHNDLPEQL